MKLLVTGASGFLGRNFLLHAPPGSRVTALYRNDSAFPDFVASLNRPEIEAIRCDLSDPGQVAMLVRDHGAEWDGCLFLSAKVDIPWSVREPVNDLLLNTVPLLNLLEAARFDRLMYFSSGAVYDGRRGEIGPETPVAPTLPYAISKLACERYVEFFHKRRKSINNYLIVRFFGAYGPYEAPHKIYTRLVHAFVMEGRRAYKIYGDGSNLIDAMYVDDAVEAIVRMLSGPHWNRIVDLASGTPTTIRDLVFEAGKALGIPDVHLETEGVAHEKNEFRASLRELESLTGFRPKIPLSEGMPKLRDFLMSAAGQ